VILVDTSVVVDYVRGKDAKLKALIPALTVGICGPVRAEVLCGVQDPPHRAKLLNYLAAFQHAAFPDSKNHRDGPVGFWI
jgi:predicted nucleic acid-binding protein